MPLASRKLALSHARSPISASAARQLKRCALSQQKKHLNLQKNSQVNLAAPYPLSRAQALPPTEGPSYGGFFTWPFGSWLGGGLWKTYMRCKWLRPRNKKAKEWPAMGCRELTSGAGPALLAVAAGLRPVLFIRYAGFCIVCGGKRATQAGPPQQT